jgi:hypothetical protein
MSELGIYWSIYEKLSNGVGLYYIAFIMIRELTTSSNSSF